ncbi:hypothetical protein B0H67DRAFT_565307 [Lasiosphaeris hirsuta]|uniref:Uncharacterized protein n=1 Tax=Lasiosphaeris hirsuta TaxID=260670 RepID=A0AA40BCV6_9PEZI|nr:hypothetical protein B0H67DRAFT_565307 [Lasiosphaeris hirsuta]
MPRRPCPSPQARPRAQDFPSTFEHLAPTVPHRSPQPAPGQHARTHSESTAANPQHTFGRVGPHCCQWSMRYHSRTGRDCLSRHHTDSNVGKSPCSHLANTSALPLVTSGNPGPRKPLRQPHSSPRSTLALTSRPCRTAVARPPVSLPQIEGPDCIGSKGAKRPRVERGEKDACMLRWMSQASRHRRHRHRIRVWSPADTRLALHAALAKPDAAGSL